MSSSLPTLKTCLRDEGHVRLEALDDGWMLQLDAEMKRLTRWTTRNLRRRT